MPAYLLNLQTEQPYREKAGKKKITTSTHPLNLQREPPYRERAGNASNLPLPNL